MALARVQYRIECPTEANATTVRGLIVTRLGAKPRFEDTPPTLPKLIGGFWYIFGSLRFSTRADAEDLRDYIQTRWNAVDAAIILAGSRIRFHLCPQGDGGAFVDCATTAEYAQVVKP